MNTFSIRKRGPHTFYVPMDCLLLSHCRHIVILAAKTKTISVPCASWQRATLFECVEVRVSRDSSRQAQAYGILCIQSNKNVLQQLMKQVPCHGKLNIINFLLLVDSTKCSMRIHPSVYPKKENAYMAVAIAEIVEPYSPILAPCRLYKTIASTSVRLRELQLHRIINRRCNIVVAMHAKIHSYDTLQTAHTRHRELLRGLCTLGKIRPGSRLYGIRVPGYRHSRLWLWCAAL